MPSLLSFAPLKEQGRLMMDKSKLDGAADKSLVEQQIQKSDMIVHIW